MTPPRRKPRAPSKPEIRPARLRKLLRHLVEIYSPFGKEGDVVDFMYEYLTNAGLPVVRQEVDEDRDNLIVVPPGVDPELVFVGHLDTVEAYDLEQTELREEGDELIGLGTADMKGGCAAMVEAYVAAWEAGLHTLPVALALVVGEEESGDGAARLVEGPYSFDTAIIGEPTDLKPCFAHYGYLEARLYTRGRRVHSSMASMGQNAINDMLHLLLRVSNHFQRQRPTVVFNIRELTSQKAGFVVPDQCEAWLDIHVPPLAPMGEISAELEELVMQESLERPGMDAELTFGFRDAGYEIPTRGRTFESLRAVFAQYGLPFDPTAFPSHSDGCQLFTAGIKPVLLGPGSLEKAHTQDESAPFSQILAAARIYLALALNT